MSAVYISIAQIFTPSVPTLTDTHGVNHEFAHIILLALLLVQMWFYHVIASLNPMYVNYTRQTLEMLATQPHDGDAWSVSTVYLSYIIYIFKRIITALDEYSNRIPHNLSLQGMSLDSERTLWFVRVELKFRNL